ncbi:MAG: MFS transporter [Spirochaetaceae bacterium]|nr:MFS transporter [Spirochaetaceae bacterium]
MIKKQKLNYFAFIWHAILLSITATFTEVNTILPAMIIKVGGNEFHIGILTSIMIGIPLIAQLLFASFLHARPKKKTYLIIGINLRVIALGLISITILSISRFTLTQALLLIYGELLLFTVSGSFAGVSYIDIIGKSFTPDVRRSLFLNKQVISSSGILVSALITREILKRIGYPENYFTLFIAATIALFIATAGFYMLKETIETGDSTQPTLLTTLKSIPERIKSDSNLKYYIIVANLLGVSLVLLPFYVSFAKAQYSLSSKLLGNLLLIQIGGMILSSFLWKILVRKHGFKGILYILSVLSAILPLLAFLFGTFLPVSAYLTVFFLSGMVLSAQRVTAEAVLVEISSNEDRTLYSGILGTFNLTVAILPFIAGILISRFGYVPLFAIAVISPAIGNRFISKLNCPIDK